MLRKKIVSKPVWYTQQLCISTEQLLHRIRNKSGMMALYIQSHLQKTEHKNSHMMFNSIAVVNKYSLDFFLNHVSLSEIRKPCKDATTSELFSVLN